LEEAITNEIMHNVGEVEKETVLSWWSEALRSNDNHESEAEA